MQCDARLREPNEKLFDQEPVVENDMLFWRQPSGPLIGKIGVVDRREAGLIALL